MASKTDQSHNFDIIIAGAGMAGLSLACLLDKYTKLSVAIIDRHSIEDMLNAEFDTRTTAISSGSSEVFKRLGLWDKLEKQGCPITSIDVQDGHSPVVLNFDANELSGTAFGWIIDNKDIRQSLASVLLKSNVHILPPAQITAMDTDPEHATLICSDNVHYKARMILAADGRFSTLRTLADIDCVEYDYGQTAMVGFVHHEKPHNNTAVERFMPDGPFAILPFNDSEDGAHRSAMVWTMHNKGPQFHSYPETLFNAALQERFDERYGDVQWIGKKNIYPLNLYHAKEMRGERLALLSDAAHAIHPIAGQGLNLGMQDVLCLADILSGVADLSLYDDVDRILNAYQTQRRPEVFKMVAATDMLNKLFSNHSKPLRFLRQAGIGLVDKIPPLKRFFSKTAMGES